MDPARTATKEQEEQGSAASESYASVGLGLRQALAVEMSPLPVATMPTPPQHWLNRPEESTTETSPVLQDYGEDAGGEGFNVRPRCRWTSVCIRLLLWKRRRLLRHGRILRSRSEQEVLCNAEVDEVSSMLLEDFTWLPEFAPLAHRCSRLLVERMEVPVEEQGAGTTQTQ